MQVLSSACCIDEYNNNNNDYTRAAATDQEEDERGNDAAKSGPDTAHPQTQTPGEHIHYSVLLIATQS